mmetsp:Transcript_11395/g.20162  ORF Transcript_11395/g.20162 Transcript_11395/m.20162 type:complete len:161 (-) Transcript_11395:89-571(-)
MSCEGLRITQVMSSAAVAAAAAPTKAARRRVRQRLHKKLGPILSVNELQEATSLLTMMVSQQPTDSMTRPVAVGPLPVKEEAGQPQSRTVSIISTTASTAAATLDDESAEEICEESSFPRLVSSPPVVGIQMCPLPVLRTFIHFTDSLVSPKSRRRSKSV